MEKKSWRNFLLNHADKEHDWENLELWEGVVLAGLRDNW